MIGHRQHLPNRRACETFGFECNSLHYLATVSFFVDGRLVEIFLSNAEAGSHSDSAVKDSAIVCSLGRPVGARPRDARGQGDSLRSAVLSRGLTLAFAMGERRW
jgi:hypothetical protein